MARPDLLSWGGSPVTLAEFKTHAGINTTGLDGALQIWIDAATQQLESETGLAVLSSSFRQYQHQHRHHHGRYEVSYNPWHHYRHIKGWITLTTPNVTAINNLSYMDTTDALQTLTWADAQAAGWSAFLSDWAEVYREDGVYPDRDSHFAERGYVEYTAGWATAADVPARVKNAIMFLATHWYRNKTAVVTGTIATELPLGWQVLVDGLRKRYWT